MWITTGPGEFEILDWPELWSAIWRVIAYAMSFQARGHCSCGCELPACDYCAHECQ